MVAAVVHYHRPGVVLKEFGQWDGRWYLRIVTGGYPAHLGSGTGVDARSVHAFFPLYPMTVRAVQAVLPVSPLSAALLVSWTVGAAACIVVWLVACEVVGRDRAHRVALAFAFFPGAFVLSMAYAESVMVALSAACLLALMRRRWWLAGVAAALATATRPNALALVLACLVAAVLAWREHGDRRGAIAVVMAPVGIAAYFGYLWMRTGSPLTWMHVERNGWGQATDFGVDTLRNISIFLHAPFADELTAIVVVGLAVTVVLARRFWKSRPPAILGAYTAGILFLCYSASYGGRPRFLLAAFPLLFPVAGLRPWAFRAFMAASTVGLVFLTWSAATVWWYAP
jgi:hypothetical protein